MIIFEEKKTSYKCISTNRLKKLKHLFTRLNGLFIPAHIDRRKNSIYSQLGFLPANLKADALEVSRQSTPEQFGRSHPEINHYPFIRSSDAHFPEDIGMAVTNFIIEEASFSEISMALEE